MDGTAGSTQTRWSISGRGAVGAALCTAIGLFAADEAAIALGWVQMGSLPGADPPGRGLALSMGMLALLVGGVALIVLRRFPNPFLSLLAPLSGAAMVARFFAFDSYYLPGSRRFADGGPVSGTWVLAVACASLLAGLLAVRWPRAAQPLSGLVMLVCWFTVLVSGTGH